MPTKTDRDLLVEIHTHVMDMKEAGIPGNCGRHDQRLLSAEARLKVIEARAWGIVSAVIIALIGVAINFFAHH